MPSLLGLRHPPLPPGYQEVEGALLDPLGSVEFAIQEVKIESIQMLWFDRLTHRDNAGQAHWQVLDVLERPTVMETEVLVLGNCRQENQRDSEILVVAGRTEDEFHTLIKSAWRANRRTMHFEVIDTIGITCENADYGF